MNTRPAIGTRVRVVGHHPWERYKGELATVTAHHADGIAFVVKLACDGRTLTCDPVNVTKAGKRWQEEPV